LFTTCSSKEKAYQLMYAKNIDYCEGPKDEKTGKRKKAGNPAIGRTTTMGQKCNWCKYGDKRKTDLDNAGKQNHCVGDRKDCLTMDRLVPLVGQAAADAFEISTTIILKLEQQKEVTATSMKDAGSLLAKLEVHTLTLTGGTSLQNVAALLFQLPMLKQLTIAVRKFGDYGAQALATVLPTLAKLESLTLTGNDIGVEGYTALVLALQPGIKKFEVSDNNIGAVQSDQTKPHHVLGNAYQKILPTLTNLEQLSLSGNKITSGGVDVQYALDNLYDGLRKLAQKGTLQELHIQENNLSEMAKEKFSDGFGSDVCFT